MYKVVIIDDEPIIVERISRMVPWEKYGCRVAGTALSGEEGLEVIRREQPDLLFFDISMAGMGGLGMIAVFRVNFPNMMIGILAGRRDFDYAQPALRLGVTRFLLKPSNPEEIEEAVDRMVKNLKRLNISGEETDGVKEREESPSGGFIVKNALVYIDQNYKEHLTLGDVAENTYVSQWHLSKLLNRHTGQNFSELLNNVRIEHAKSLLRDSSLRIGDIAGAVGFVDIAHFSRVFKKIVGVSANEYRNRRIWED